MVFDPAHIALLIAAATLAGAINAAAGGGSLISFPALLLVGLPAISANVTNTVALCPGYLGGTIGYKAQLAGQRERMRRLGIIAVVGAIVGVLLLQLSSAGTFRTVVPFLLLLACVLLVFQRALSEWVLGRDPSRAGGVLIALDLAAFAAAAYGAYFGAAMGVLLLAVLGVLVKDSLQRLNALKSYLSLVVNVVAALLFAYLGPVQWEAVLIMLPASLLGGRAGARLAGRVSASTLRRTVAAVGIVVAVLLLSGA
jgi:uncharacterized membrane protein YfcA